MPSRNYDQDVEDQASAEICPIFCENLEKTSSRRQRNIFDWAGQGCFLCLDNPREGHYAVFVPCIKPHRYRREVGLSKIFTKNPEPIYETVAPWETACEPDSEIWGRLVQACYQYQGRWRRWVPFYGITEVQEVTFEFAGVVERDGRYPILMKWLQSTDVERRCLDKIERHMEDCVDINDSCQNGYSHSSQCLINMEAWSQPCRQIEAELAEERLRLLRSRHRLTEYALQPEKADGMFTFEGFAQDGCIYDVKGPDSIAVPRPFERYKHTAQLRGLSIVLGWHKQRIVREVPFHASCAWFGVAVVWLCVLFLRTGSGDWGITLGFAQVVAASISILISFTGRR